MSNVHPDRAVSSANRCTSVCIRLSIPRLRVVQNWPLQTPLILLGVRITRIPIGCTKFSRLQSPARSTLFLLSRISVSTPRASKHGLTPTRIDRESFYFFPIDCCAAGDSCDVLDHDLPKPLRPAVGLSSLRLRDFVAAECRPACPISETWRLMCEGSRKKDLHTRTGCCPEEPHLSDQST